MFLRSCTAHVLSSFTEFYRVFPPARPPVLVPVEFEQTAVSVRPFSGVSVEYWPQQQRQQQQQQQQQQMRKWRCWWCRFLARRRRARRTTGTCTGRCASTSRSSRPRRSSSACAPISWRTATCAAPCSPIPGTRTFQDVFHIFDVVSCGFTVRFVESIVHTHTKKRAVPLSVLWLVVVFTVNCRLLWYAF